jgi:hypothetical protein
LEHALQPNADLIADFLSPGTRSKRPVSDEDDDNTVDKNAKAVTKRQGIHIFSLCTRTARRWMTRATRLIGINYRAKSRFQDEEADGQGARADCAPEHCAGMLQ